MIKWQEDFEKARALTFNPAQNKSFLCLPYSTPLPPKSLVFSAAPVGFC